MPVTAALLDGRGVATETIRVVNIAAFLALKCLAYEDRIEEKDAYDIIYGLTYYQEGPVSVAGAFTALSFDNISIYSSTVLEGRFSAARWSFTPNKISSGASSKRATR